MRVLLVVYDNQSYIHMFPQGIAYLASAIREAGHSVTIYNQDVHHYPNEHLTNYLDTIEKFDVVGVGVIGGYYQYKKLLEISRSINASSRRPRYYILGGHGPTPEPEYFLSKTGADIVVMGEGEETIVELLSRIDNRKSYSDVRGIAYVFNSRCIINPRRPLLDVDTISWPAYDMFPIEYYRLMRSPTTTQNDFLMPVLSARGCTFKCNFCYRMDKGYRPRSPESIVEEVKFLQKNYGITYNDFLDDLLMASEHRVVDVCNAILKSGLKFRWWCNGRLNYATPSILKLMKEAGCSFINYGIESFDNKILEVIQKHLTTEQIIKGVEATLDTGISPGLNIIFGNIGETKEILQKGVDFLLKYSNGSQLRTIRPVTPYPGSPLYYHAIEKGLLGGIEDFYENKCINSDLLTVNFTDMSDNDFYGALFNANSEIINHYYKRKRNRTLEIAHDLYLNRNRNFRGFRNV